MSLTTLLNIKYPIIQGGMANISLANLVAAVSNSGGLGVIGSGSWDKEQLRAEIRKCKALTDKPFGVNLMLMNPHRDDLAEVVIEEKVAVVTTGAGSPGPYIEKWKEAGIKVIPVVPSVALAKRMARVGADAIIVEGTESGGHVGELTTMALVPQVVDAVDIPVIAAGGIADGRGTVAALALGACGVQIGKRFLTAHECGVHENYKNSLIKAKDTDTVVTGRSVGVPVRCIKNKMSREYVALEKKGVTAMELEHLTLGSLRKAVLEGDTQNGSVMAGQITGMLSKTESTQEIIEDIMNHATQVLENLKLA
ncbi:MAG: enoyl-[acyl-carrier-protein] reductase FabK [Turicibacter sp.]